MNFYSTSEIEIERERSQNVVASCMKSDWDVSFCIRKYAEAARKRKRQSYFQSIPFECAWIQLAFEWEGGCWLQHIDFHSFIELFINSMHIKIGSWFIEKYLQTLYCQPLSTDTQLRYCLPRGNDMPEKKKSIANSSRANNFHDFLINHAQNCCVQ